MLLKCCTQNASKFGNSSSGHRTGKGLFSFQSQGMAMPKNAQEEVKVIQSCPTLNDPMDYRVQGILQAKILEWVAVPFSKGSSQPRGRTQVSCIAGRFFTSWATREAQECSNYCTIALISNDRKIMLKILQARWEGNRQEGQWSPNGGNRLQVSLKILYCSDNNWFHLRLTFLRPELTNVFFLWKCFS